MESFKNLIDIHPKVQQAIDQNDPVVALESTIITHGMDYPVNKDTAILVEQTVRDNGAIPATIAIIKGRIKVGLELEDIDYLATQGKNCKKCSRRDLASIIVKKQDGSTTVATTMIIAKMVGIHIFVTGGIGGVHRGAENTFDISADLLELGQTPVCVVAAGAKSILDLPKTLEYLETQGVPVVGFQTNNFPEFFVSDSGYRTSTSVENETEAALLIKTQFKDLQLKGGILLCNPVPKEEEANGQVIKQAIDQALKESIDQNILGAEVTPFLLKRINEITDGASSKSNIALIKNNAKVGSRVAIQLSKIMRGEN